LNTDRWYYRVFQSAPDLIRALLPGAAGGANSLSLDPSAPGDSLYRFEALELKELNHRLDGVLWPRESTGCAKTGSRECPVVLLEVQMHPDPGFKHRLAAQTCRFLQKHPQLDQPGGAEPTAQPRSPAQPAHAAREARERAGGQQSTDPRQPP
jgi:hypothetical protein